MSVFWWAASTFVLGLTMGVVVMVILDQMAADAQAGRRAAARARLGLPDRPPTRSGAVGTARVHTAEYHERKSDSGMEM